MTYQATGYIRDYNSSTDTATVELIGLGIIDVWLDGCKVNAGVNRAYLVHGAEATLSFPDAHRLCEGSIVSVAAQLTAAAAAFGSGLQNFQTGRVGIPTSAGGGGSVTVTFPSAYTSAPQLYAGSDEFIALQVGIPTATQFTLTIAPGAGPANSTVYCTWYAFGH